MWVSFERAPLFITKISKLKNVWMPRKPFSKYSLFAGWWGLVQYLLDGHANYTSNLLLKRNSNEN
jgi:hypothetical protein